MFDFDQSKKRAEIIFPISYSLLSNTAVIPQIHLSISILAKKYNYKFNILQIYNRFDFARSLSGSPNYRNLIIIIIDVLLTSNNKLIMPFFVVFCHFLHVVIFISTRYFRFGFSIAFSHFFSHHTRLFDQK